MAKESSTSTVTVDIGHSKVEKFAQAGIVDSSWQDAYIFLPDGTCYSYWTQEHAPYGDAGQVFAQF